ncbi:MAG: hypothetical protein ACK5L0_02745 [Candidatus Fimivivens sp.]
MAREPKYCQGCGVELLNPRGRYLNCDAKSIPIKCFICLWFFAGVLSTIIIFVVMAVWMNNEGAINVAAASSPVHAHATLTKKDVPLGAV